VERKPPILPVVSLEDAENLRLRRARLERTIREISARKKAVTFSEIKVCWMHLASFGLEPMVRKTKESHLLSARGARFSVSAHNRGSKHVKSCYVGEFLEAMEKLGFLREKTDENED
jgi:hypothetical protein